MPQPQRWKFDQVEIVTGNFVIRAGELGVLKRVERTHELVGLLEGWLGEPRSRNALRAIEREVTFGELSMGRSTGRENDVLLIANLLSAFRAGKLHVLRGRPNASPGPLATDGRTWRFAGAEILESDCALKVGKLAEFLLVKDASQFARAVDLWLKDSEDRQRVLDVHQAAVASSDTKLDDDRKITDELLEAWRDGKLHFLKRRIEGGGEDTSAEQLNAVLGVAAKRAPSDAKTWIEIVLVDEKGKPVAGEKYRIRITDGSVREGSLDSDGRVRINGIDPGSCEVSFPNVDGKEWRAA